MVGSAALLYRCQGLFIYYVIQVPQYAYYPRCVEKKSEKFEILWGGTLVCILPTLSYNKVKAPSLYCRPCAYSAFHCKHKISWGIPKTKYFPRKRSNLSITKKLYQIVLFVSHLHDNLGSSIRGRKLVMLWCLMQIREVQMGDLVEGITWLCPAIHFTTKVILLPQI